MPLRHELSHEMAGDDAPVLFTDACPARRPAETHSTSRRSSLAQAGDRLLTADNPVLEHLDR
jgi:hypothetical protein